MGIVSITIIGLIIVVFLAVAIERTISAHRHPVASGSEELIGKKAIALSALNPKGTVLLEGEIWRAILEEGHAENGEEVVVKRREGLTLYVARPSP